MLFGCRRGLPLPHRFVHVQHLEAESLSLTFRLHQGSRPPTAAAAPLRLSRTVEERVADLEGLADVRHWMQLIGRGEEHEWIDLGTVKGYKRVVFCQGIRDDVEANLGPAAWATLLPRMCEGRLVPTPWLNKVRTLEVLGRGEGGLVGDACSCGPLSLPSTSQPPTPSPHPTLVRFSLLHSRWFLPPPPPPCTHTPPLRTGVQDFREPLYLLDRPVWVEDTRSEEERRYPELFRQKLEAEGWSVPKPVSTVPIPGYNMPMNGDYRQL